MSWAKTINLKTTYTSEFGKVWSEKDESGKTVWYAQSPISKRSFGEFKTANKAQAFLKSINNNEKEFLKYLNKINKKAENYEAWMF